jgi:hypothetical protein
VGLSNLCNDKNVDFEHTDQVMAFDVTDEDFTPPTAPGTASQTSWSTPR